MTLRLKYRRGLTYKHTGRHADRTGPSQTARKRYPAPVARQRAMFVLPGGRHVMRDMV
jgi:hypothetical protein